MSLTLYVDSDRFHTHLKSVRERLPRLVPVAKGNGYGLTNPRLAIQAQNLGCDMLAVGTYDELAQVQGLFAGDLLVLTPWRPFGAAVEREADGRVVHTVSRLEDVDALVEQEPAARLVLERMTSMLRHGLSARELRAAAVALEAYPDVRVEGVALHLPLGQAEGHLAEMTRLMTDVVAAGLPTRTVFVSHLSTAELDTLAAAYPEYDFRLRIGTGLWLGDRQALQVKATVLDVHPVGRGQAYGYRGRIAPRAGWIVVVTGGTAHGIGMAAPTGEGSLKARASAFARGGLEAAGLVRSPYRIAGKQRLFAEPPHMQASMLFLPDDVTPPAVGEEVELQVRFTATTFDRTVVR